MQEESDKRGSLINKNKMEQEMKSIKDFEFILTQFSETQQLKNTLTFDDLGHSLYLMKFFVAYPRNYAGLKFTDGKQLSLYLREKEILL